VKKRDREGRLTPELWLEKLRLSIRIMMKDETDLK
jgi:hypothetical protein